MSKTGMESRLLINAMSQLAYMQAHPHKLRPKGRVIGCIEHEHRHGQQPQPQYLHRPPVLW
jgi:hypothetical protein